MNDLQFKCKKNTFFYHPFMGAILLTMVLVVLLVGTTEALAVGVPASQNVPLATSENRFDDLQTEVNTQTNLPILIRSETPTIPVTATATLSDSQNPNVSGTINDSPTVTASTTTIPSSPPNATPPPQPSSDRPIFTPLPPTHTIETPPAQGSPTATEEPSTVTELIDWLGEHAFNPLLLAGIGLIFLFASLMVVLLSLFLTRREASGLTPVAPIPSTAEPTEGRERNEAKIRPDNALDTLRYPTNMIHIVGRLSDVGQKRKLNEDNLLTLEIEQVQKQSKPIGLYLVADGMGGHAAGEVASELASQTVGSTITKQVMLPMMEGKKRAESGDLYANLLKEACLNANRVVFSEARKRKTKMGTTLVVALVVGQHAYIANIGDSRAYLVEQAGIRQLTTDHSLVERLIAARQISREEAHTHPHRNIIYRTVGDKAKVEVDLFQHQLKDGQWLVLCSDGLHGMVSDTDIQQTVISSLDPQEACKELIRMANQAGGDDNISVIVVKLEEMGKKR